MLEELKQYLSTNHMASLQELTEYFATDEDTMREMLATWEAKGKVHKLDNLGTSCGKCAHCHHFPEEIYEWIESNS